MCNISNKTPFDDLCLKLSMKWFVVISEKTDNGSKIHKKFPKNRFFRKYTFNLIKQYLDIYSMNLGHYRFYLSLTVF